MNAAVDLNAPALVKAILARKPDLSYTSSLYVTQFALSRAIIALCGRNNRDNKDQRKKAQEIIQDLLAYGCSPSQKDQSPYPSALSLETHLKWDYDTYCSVTTPLEIVKAFNQFFYDDFKDIEQLLIGNCLSAE